MIEAEGGWKNKNENERGKLTLKEDVSGWKWMTVNGSGWKGMEGDISG